MNGGRTFKQTLVGTVLLLGLVGPCGAHVVDEPRPPAPQADAEQKSWEKEFDEVCSKTQDALTFSEEELKDLIRRCDALLPQIEKLDESQKKVYLGRLRKCRGLYAYVLDAKANEKK